MNPNNIIIGILFWLESFKSDIIKVLLIDQYRRLIQYDTCNLTAFFLLPSSKDATFHFSPYREKKSFSFSLFLSIEHNRKMLMANCHEIIIESKLST